MTTRLSGHTLLIGLLAKPIRHSLSPKMHNEAFEKLGLDYAYLAFDVAAEDLANAIQGVRALGMVGANISMPHKQTVIPLLDELSQEAELIGAVNTIVYDEETGRIKGYNTDGIGAIRALKAEGVDVKDAVITLTGTGGAGTAIAIQAAFTGAKEIRLFNMKDPSYQNGEKIVGKINNATSCVSHINDLADTDLFYQSIKESDIYIDATGVGMASSIDQKLINDAQVIHHDLVVFDVVYSPSETALLKFAREHHAKKAINGLGMMLYQGAEAFKLFTGEDMPIEHVKHALDLAN